MFHDRVDAGRRLAAKLMKFRDLEPVIVALPRGGVPVAWEVARALDAPLDVLIARKLGAPGQPELGIGAVAQGGALYLDVELISHMNITREYLHRVAREEALEMERRLRVYRGDRAPLDVMGRTVILVDDGLATGVTTRAAVRALRRQSPRAIILAVPVCAPETAAALRAEVDHVICVESPERFGAVGAWYTEFAQTTDEEVVTILTRAVRAQSAREAQNHGARTTDADLSRWSVP